MSPAASSLAAYESAGDALAIDELLVTADGTRIIAWSHADGETSIAQFSADTLEPLTGDSDGLVYRGVDDEGRIGYSGGRSLPAYPGDRQTGDLTFWDMSNGERISQVSDGFNWSILSADLTAATDELLFITFAGETALLGIGDSAGGQRIVLVNIADGSVTRVFENELAAKVISAEFVDASAVLSATRDNRLLLWSSEDGSLIREIGSTTETLEQIRQSPTGDTIAGLTSDGTLYLWRLDSATASPAQVLPDAARGTTITREGNLLLVTADGISLRGLDTGESRAQFAPGLLDAAGGRFAIFTEGIASIYDAETGAEIRSWTTDIEEARAIWLSPIADMLVVDTASAGLWLLNSNPDSPRQLPIGELDQAVLTTFANDGERFLTLHRRRAVLWDATTGTALGAYPLDVPPDATVGAIFGADEALHFFIRLENGVAGLTRVSLSDNTVERQTFVDVHHSDFTADGQYLTMALTSGGLQIIETARGDIVHQLEGVGVAASALRYLPAKNLLAAATGRELILWDAAAGEIEQEFSHPYPIEDLSLSRDGMFILTRDERGTHRLRRVESAAELLARIERDFEPRALTCAERAQYAVFPLCE